MLVGPSVVPRLSRSRVGGVCVIIQTHPGYAYVFLELDDASEHPFLKLGMMLVSWRILQLVCKYCGCLQATGRCSQESGTSFVIEDDVDLTATSC